MHQNIAAVLFSRNFPYFLSSYLLAFSTASAINAVEKIVPGLRMKAGQ